MPTIPRSSRPTCPACGFPVFNRRCARCEKCQAELPPSIAYTPAEIATLLQQDRVEDDKRERRMAKARAERARRGAGSVTGGVVGSEGSKSDNLLDAIDLGFDLGDIGGGD